MERRGVIIFILLLFVPLILFADYDIGHYNQARNDALFAFYADSSFGDVIMGGGYLPSIDFDYTINLYKNFYKVTNNPFYAFALGESYYFYKKPDSAEYYYNKSIDSVEDFYHALYLYIMFLQPTRRMYEENSFNRVVETMPTTGGELFPSLALLELNYGKINVKATSTGKTSVIDKAIMFYPNNPLFYVRKREIAISQGDITGIVSNTITSISLWFKGVYNQSILLYNMLRFLIVLVSVSFGIFVVYLILKYVKFVLPFISYKFPRFYRKDYSKYLILSVLLLPFIYFVSPFFIVAYIVIIFSPFLSKVERRIVYIFYAIVIIIFPVVFSYIHSIEEALSPHSLLFLIEKASFSSYDSDILSGLDSIKTDNRDTLFYVNWMKGLLYKRNGEFDKAEEYYNKCLDIKKDSRIYNNIGNLYYLRGEYKKCAEYYGKSLELDDSRPTINYNLSQLYFKALKIAEGEQYLNRAMAINGDLINKFSAQSAIVHYNTKLMDDVPSNREIWKFIKLRMYLNYKYAGMTGKYGIVASLIIMLLVFIGGKMYVSNYKICSSCGKIIFRKYDVKEFSEFIVCPDCFNQIEKGKTDSYKFTLYERLYNRYYKSKKRNIKYLSAVFPGIMHVINEQKISGWILIVLSTLSLSFIVFSFYKIWPLPYTNDLFIGSDNIYRVVLFAIVALMYIISFFSIKPPLRR